MNNRLRLGMVVLITQAIAGCGAEAGRASVPTAPSSPSSSTSPPSVVNRPVWPTGVFVPNVTVSGVVSEGAGVPIERVWVYCELCGEETHSGMHTDARGFYSFKGVWDTVVSIYAAKDGYEDPLGKPSANYPNGTPQRDVTINGDTRIDFQLARK